ncbi:Rieske 2Fe-2S domain-containing protein [Klebsiella pneumoniae]|nr:Rieske 2Fe-2S domain-containing protein [Klebsiella pneumoniae]
MKTITPTPPAHCTFDPEDWLRLARCWHPVARACDIAGAPVKATLLDEQLVIYRIKGGGSRPRRLPAPRGAADPGFHEEEGIVCPYHGLRFGEDGRCNRIPSSPGQPIPAKLHLTSFAVEERYGLIWTCLACDPDNPPPLPTMPHWDDAGFQQINCPAFEVKGFAGRRGRRLSRCRPLRVDPHRYLRRSGQPAGAGLHPAGDAVRLCCRLLELGGQLPGQHRFPRAGRVPVAASL